MKDKENYIIELCCTTDSANKNMWEWEDSDLLNLTIIDLQSIPPLQLRRTPIYFITQCLQSYASFPTLAYLH